MKYSILTVLAVSAIFSSSGVFANTDQLTCIDSSSDTDGDGWGWENGLSCKVADAAPAICTDSDGDGYGWDGEATCFLTVAPTDCIDTDGDGFGWDGVGTCFLDDSILDIPFVDPFLELEQAVCVDTDPMGDTWGWNGVFACRIAPALVGGDTSAIAGIWDTTDSEYPDEENYTVITSDGLIGDIYSDINVDGSKCYVTYGPENTDEDGTVITPLGNNVYRFESYYIYADELELDSNEFTIFVTEENSLSVTFDDEIDSTTTLNFPAATINPDELSVCDFNY